LSERASEQEVALPHDDPNRNLVQNLCDDVYVGTGSLDEGGVDACNTEAGRDDVEG
jgi:predicted HAD superfamily Cof-like phosphohydrolase